MYYKCVKRHVTFTKGEVTGILSEILDGILGMLELVTPT